MRLSLMLLVMYNKVERLTLIDLFTIVLF